ncbi:hypothetical protein BDQ12DRAFT_472240 [Crucibulum laeve]|uniref:Uncharacterized protein n=1 Tax=Crucibulum laeve TaxID=68775 RepID=A0A5C3LIH8_9AGAR|nr:hypothetical protein BDQ12DRAFT_472240 [Crucibulum laeve]
MEDTGAIQGLYYLESCKSDSCDHSVVPSLLSRPHLPIQQSTKVVGGHFRVPRNLVCHHLGKSFSAAGCDHLPSLSSTEHCSCTLVVRSFTSSRADLNCTHSFCRCSSYGVHQVYCLHAVVIGGLVVVVVAGCVVLVSTFD